MYKNKIFALISICLVVPTSFAMQPLDDQGLSATTGQDGINLGIGLNKIEFSQVSLIDNDGIASPIAGKTYNGRSALAIAGNTDAPVSVNFVGANTTPTINVVMDTDGGNGKAFANLGVSFGSQISGIKISPFSIYLASAGAVSSKNTSQSLFSTAGGLSAGVAKLLEIGSDTNNFEINFHNTNKPQINIQLGNVPQGQMMQFSGAIQSICGTGSGCPISVISGDTAAKFDFQVKATDASNGFRLNGFYAGIESTGVTFGNTGSSDKLNVAINNVTLGKDTAISPTVFNGLPNGSMGSFGAVGASVKDLKVSVRGL